MITTKNAKMKGFVLASTAMFLLAGCATGGSPPPSDTAPMVSPEGSPAPTGTPMPTASDDTAYANLVGMGCEMYDMEVPDGPGSITGMSQDPVVVAVSNNPKLTQLASAVSGQMNPDVDLVDTLNGDAFTVFAPTDEAFAALDADTLATLQTPEGAKMLNSILTYHVVPGQIAPDAIMGEQTTVQGEEITVEGSGDNLTVNEADVICGGIQTANATVYLIDAVLMPASMD